MSINTDIVFPGTSLRYFIILAFLSLFTILPSCQPDLPPELNCDQAYAGLICREDAYERGRFIGYVDYSYFPDNKLYQKKYYSVNHSFLEETYHYNDKNLLMYLKGKDKDGNLQEEKVIERNVFDSIATITKLQHGKLVVYTIFEYDSLNRLSKRTDFESDSVLVKVYTYTDENKLYKEALFEKDQLLAYTIYKNYLNNITKVFEYNKDDELLQQQLIIKDNKDNVLEIRKYDNQSQLKGQEIFLYIDQQLIKHSWFTGNSETEFRLFHYP